MVNSQDKEQEALLQRRLQGILPQIDIAGDKYFADVRIKELRFTKAAHISLQFREMDLDEFSGRYFFFYDKTAKVIYPADADPAKIPNGIVAVAIPYDGRLDPVGYAQTNNYSIEEILKLYPVQMELKAEVRELDEQTRQRLIEDRDKLLIIGPKIKNDPRQANDKRSKDSIKKKGKHL